MDDTSEQNKEELTEPLDQGSSHIPQDSAEETTDKDGLLMDRRTYLAAAGLTTAALAGCTSRDRSETVSPVSAFGYGGSPTLQQTSSLTVSESEPNDREGSADAIDVGTTVSGTLTANDSDWYVVDLSGGSDVAVKFSRTASVGITAVILYDPDGKFSNLRYVSTDEPVAMVQTIETTGTYFVQVVNTQGSDGGYTVTVRDGTTTPTETATPVATPTETATPVATPTDTATPAEDDYGEQGYGDYGYGGIAV